MDSLSNLAVENFREYLRIPSVHPDVNYDDCVTFLKKQAASIEIKFQVHYFFPGKPIVILTWTGREPDVPTIMLNSHMDVVPVYKEQWTHDPFAAEMDERGNIYGRGSQDMKCVGIQYLEAIRRLKKDNVSLRRTLHVTFVPDEEINGVEGMQAFVKSKEFRGLNVGFALDEGMASPNDVFALFNGERAVLPMIVHCPGQPGHGSLLLRNTAGEKIRKMLDKFYDFRQEEEKKLKNDPSLTLGNVTSINVTIAKGGVQRNVIPAELTFEVDCRLSPTIDVAEFERTLQKWCEEAGEGVWIEFVARAPQIPPIKLDESNPFWIAIKEASDSLNIELKPEIFPAATDSSNLRELGIQALGFSPMNNTPVLLHDNDEYLNKDVFLRGIKIYCALIAAVANVEDE